MRCNDCNKFVSYGEIQTEVDSEELYDETLKVSVRVVLTCNDCGSELKDCVIEFEETVTHDCDEADKEIEDEFYELVSVDTEGTDRREEKDSKGKPINSRYQKTFYGASMTATIRCNRCDEQFTVEASDDEQASSFEELQ